MKRYLILFAFVCGLMSCQPKQPEIPIPNDGEQQEEQPTGVTIDKTNEGGTASDSTEGGDVIDDEAPPPTHYIHLPEHVLALVGFGRLSDTVSTGAPLTLSNALLKCHIIDHWDFVSLNEGEAFFKKNETWLEENKQMVDGIKEELMKVTTDGSPYYVGHWDPQYIYDSIEKIEFTCSEELFGVPAGGNLMDKFELIRVAPPILFSYPEGEMMGNFSQYTNNWQDVISQIMAPGVLYWKLKDTSLDVKYGHKYLIDVNVTLKNGGDISIGKPGVIVFSEE